MQYRRKIYFRIHFHPWKIYFLTWKNIFLIYFHTWQLKCIKYIFHRCKCIWKIYFQTFYHFKEIYFQQISQISVYFHCMDILCCIFQNMENILSNSFKKDSTFCHSHFKQTQFLFIHARFSARFLMLPNLTNHYIKLSDGDLQCE